MKSAEKFGHRYPWAKWLAQRELVLERGRDFQCEPSSLAVMMRVELSRRKLLHLKSIAVRGDYVIVAPKMNRRSFASYLSRFGVYA